MFEEVTFNVTINEALHSITVVGYGFEADIKRGLKFNASTGQYYEVYSILMDRCKPIALSQTELRKYIMFLEYLEFYVQALNE